MNKRNAKTSLVLELLETAIIAHNNEATCDTEQMDVTEYLLGIIDLYGMSNDISDEKLIEILIAQPDDKDAIYNDL